MNNKTLIFKWADLALQFLTIIVTTIYFACDTHFYADTLILIIPILLLCQLFSSIVNLIVIPRLNTYMKLTFLVVGILLVLSFYIIVWWLGWYIFVLGAALNTWYLLITIFEIMKIRKQIQA